MGITPKNRERRNMSLSDQTLYCRDCNAEFTFTVGEQEFYASRGLPNSPSRCPECRAARKQSGGYSSGGRSGGGGYHERAPRRRSKPSCATWAIEPQVLFQ